MEVVNSLFGMLLGVGGCGGGFGLEVGGWRGWKLGILCMILVIEVLSCIR